MRGDEQLRDGTFVEHRGTMERGRAVVGGGVHLGPGGQQRFDGALAPVRRGFPERRLAEAGEGVHVGLRRDQRLHDLLGSRLVESDPP